MNQKFIQRVKALWEKFIQNRSIYKKLYAKYERATADLNKIRHNRNALRVEHKRTTDAFNQLREEHDKLFVKQDALSKNYERATADLDGVRRNLNALSLEHERTKSDFNKLRGEHDALSQKYKLISDLLDTKPGKNEKFEKFKKLVKKDFMNFANKESSLAEEADAVRKMQTIEKRLEEIVAFPHTFTKKSIAIGGAFSSGKSEFVNSFITGSNVKMHVNVKRATAIPSFIISSSSVSIKGFSRYGSTVDIEPEFYSQLTHNFIKTFSFNLKGLMPSITVEVPLAKDLFKNICLIDTPGYNSAGRNATEDRTIAAASLKGRGALIWVIDVSNGTVPEDDLEFIYDLKLNGVPFYVVLNKADRRNKNECKKILAEVRKTLKAEGIKYKGISLYSATKRKEYLSDEMDLHEFFRSQNQPVVDIEIELKGEIKGVFEMYEKAICKDERTAKRLMDKLNELSLDISSELENSKLDPDEMDDLTEKIDKIRKSQNKDFTSIKEQMTQIKKKMLEAVDEILWSIGAQSAEAVARPLSAPKPDNKKSTVRRQGYIRGEEYIKTNAEQSEKPAYANPQPRADLPRNHKKNTEARTQSQFADHRPKRLPPELHFDSRDLKKEPKKSKRIYEVANEFNLSSTAMVSRLRNLGFQVKNHMSVYTPAMAEAVKRELDSERQAVKKNTEVAPQAQELININQATAQELERLFGIRPETARYIVGYREQNGPFQSIEDLMRDRGISPRRFYTLVWNLIRAEINSTKTSIVPLSWAKKQQVCRLINVLKQAKKQQSQD